MKSTKKRGDEIAPTDLIDGDRFHYPGKKNRVWTAIWKKRILHRYEGMVEPKQPEPFPANRFMKPVVYLRNIHVAK